MYIVYGAPFCGWCQRAKSSLEREGVKFKYIDIQEDDTEWKKVAKQHSFRTIPQIFKDGAYLGGFHELEQHLISSKI